MRASVIVFPGSNRDRDMQMALTRAGGRPPAMVWHAETALPPSDLIVLPGGFAYGDYLRAGAIAARAPVMAEVRRAAEAGTPVLAVCNGFQVAIEAGLLPGALMTNASLRFVCKQVHLRVERADSRFTAGYDAGEVIRVPVAHHDGNYYADDATLSELEAEGRILFRYCAADGALDDGANPNGSRAAVAGIVNRAGNVLGMMPHPENATDPAVGGTDGRPLFQSLVEALA